MLNRLVATKRHENAPKLRDVPFKLNKTHEIPPFIKTHPFYIFHLTLAVDLTLPDKT